tara:strand:- start:11 stop:409 length:399 start_codon:yes stop_codon:yes gene_type:complete
MIVNKSFQIIKTISYADSEIVKEKVENLKTLKDKTFNKIKIPHFSFNVYENVISIHMEFIKGQVLNNHNKLSYKNTILKDLVERDDKFSAAGYAPGNFIIGDDGFLYFVDLEDMRFIDHEERMFKFKKDFLK